MGPFCYPVLLGRHYQLSPINFHLGQLEYRLEERAVAP